jgi:hypothetical protein
MKLRNFGILEECVEKGWYRVFMRIGRAQV